jgi:hypothetical protein
LVQGSTFFGDQAGDGRGFEHLAHFFGGGAVVQGGSHRRFDGVGDGGGAWVSRACAFRTSESASGGVTPSFSIAVSSLPMSAKATVNVLIFIGARVHVG